MCSPPSAITPRLIRQAACWPPNAAAAVALAGREMAALFRDIPEAIANTRIVSQRLDFTLNNLGYEFPHYPVPDGETMDSFLAKRVDEGVRKRYGSAGQAASV